jgi:hypothetical protein
MPVNDWTRVSAGTFHDFHTSWIAELKKALNNGLLPRDYYSQAEQIAGKIIPDVRTLNAARPSHSQESTQPPGTTAVAEAPPQVSITDRVDEAVRYAVRQRSIVIRHSTGDEVVGLIEIVSPGNKNSTRALERFVDKAVAALTSGIHLLLLDLFPPGIHDPDGIHGVLWSEFTARVFQQPADKPLTLAAYAAGDAVEAYVEPIAVGSTLPDMPVFLTPDWYVAAPLESTYQEAYASVPERWRNVIDGSALAD